MARVSIGGEGFAVAATVVMLSWIPVLRRDVRWLSRISLSPGPRSYLVSTAPGLTEPSLLGRMIGYLSWCLFAASFGLGESSISYIERGSA